MVALLALAHDHAISCSARPRLWRQLSQQDRQPGGVDGDGRLAHCAAPAPCEADLAAALDSLLDAGRMPDAEELRRRFAPRTGEAPAIVVVLPAVAAYDALIAVSDHYCERCRSGLMMG
jgi:hypothetical protein